MVASRFMVWLPSNFEDCVCGTYPGLMGWTEQPRGLKRNAARPTLQDPSLEASIRAGSQSLYGLTAEQF